MGSGGCEVPFNGGRQEKSQGVVDVKIISSGDCERAAELLDCAAHIMQIEFYSSRRENRNASLECRIFGLSPMTQKEVDELAFKLNAAILSVKQEVAAVIQGDAKEYLKGE